MSLPVKEKELLLSAERLRQILDYDPDTGVFVWKKPHQRVRPGAVAGCPHNDGYWVISISGRNYLAHRLAVLWMTGLWPPEEVDHIDRNRRNNRWLNLFPCSREQNRLNQDQSFRLSASSTVTKKQLAALEKKYGLS